MKNYAMTETVLVEGCPAAAVRPERRAVNRIAPVFPRNAGENSVLLVTGITGFRSGHAPGSPPD